MMFDSTVSQFLVKLYALSLFLVYFFARTTITHTGLFSYGNQADWVKIYVRNRRIVWDVEIKPTDPIFT